MNLIGCEVQFSSFRGPSRVDYKALPPTELVLCCLRTGGELARTEFVRRFQPLISRVAFRVTRQWGQACSSVIDDLVQETYLKLCADRFR
jgi:RNA polymerase sigma-70 factor, ECF subfamily